MYIAHKFVAISVLNKVNLALSPETFLAPALRLAPFLHVCVYVSRNCVFIYFFF